jgi:hypothetical protein
VLDQAADDLGSVGAGAEGNDQFER